MDDSNAIRDAIERSKASGQIQTVSVEMTVDGLEDLKLLQPHQNNLSVVATLRHYLT